MIAARPEASPVTTAARHSGRSIGRRSMISMAATSSSAGSSPGEGQTMYSMCRWMVKLGSSTHTARPQPGGTFISRCRNRGTARTRSASVSVTTSASKPSPGSSTKTAPNCCGTEPRCRAANIRSADPARSIRSAGLLNHTMDLGWLRRTLRPALDAQQYAACDQCGCRPSQFGE